MRYTEILRDYARKIIETLDFFCLALPESKQVSGAMKIVPGARAGFWPGKESETQHSNKQILNFGQVLRICCKGIIYLAKEKSKSTRNFQATLFRTFQLVDLAMVFRRGATTCLCTSFAWSRISRRGKQLPENPSVLAIEAMTNRKQLRTNWVIP